MDNFHILKSDSSDSLSTYPTNRGSLQEGTEFPSAPLQPFARLGCSQ